MKLHEILPETTVPQVDDASSSDHPQEIESGTIDLATRMRAEKGKPYKKGENRKKAEKLRNVLKGKAQQTNPEDTETPSGWRADPHQGNGPASNWRVGIS